MTGENEPLKSSDTHISKQVFVNAQEMPYFVGGFLVISFFVIPFTILYFFIKSWLKGFSPVLIFSTLGVLLMFSVLIMIFMFIRKYYVLKIVIKTSGITFNGLFKNIHGSWDGITSVKPFTSDFIRKTWIEVNTKNDKFYFPLTMKGEDQEYPKLITGLAESHWEDSNGNKEPVTPENCPLYVEMQKHLGNK